MKLRKWFLVAAVAVALVACGRTYTGPDPEFGIALNRTGTHSFDGLTAGYGIGVITPLPVTVTNTGNRAIGSLYVELLGTNHAAFTVSRNTLPGIAVGGTDTFDVRPVTGLAVGTYSATVTVTGANNISAAFDVSVVVSVNHAFSVTLSHADHTFPTLTVDYAVGDFAPLTVTVTNTGTQPTGQLAVALSGANTTAFTLGLTPIPSIAVGGTSTFTVSPALDQAVGTYNAIVTVSGANSAISAALTVTMTVEPAPEPGANLTIAFAELVDRAPLDADIIRTDVSILDAWGTITVENPTTEIRWFYNGEEIGYPNVTGDYNATFVPTRELLGADLGTRFITVVVEVGGRLYGRRITIEVGP